ncbi:MAG: RNA polymerase factor sigma-54 [Bacteroidota bacterium]
MLGQRTNLSLQQKLSPRQIQLMNLVQLSVTELEQRLKEELESNPALEEGVSQDEDSRNEDILDFERAEERTYELDEYLQSYIEEDPSSYNQSSERTEPDTARAMAVEQQSFFEYLEQQLAGLDFQDEAERTLAAQIVGSIGDDGYLQRKPSAIADDLLLYHDLEFRQEEVLKMLQRIQRFDPPGVGAQDLRECLLIQLDLLIEQDELLSDAQLADMVLARRILREHFEAFSKKHYDKLLQKLEVDEDELRDALQEVLRLNPKPASAFGGNTSSTSSQAIIPDFVISKEDQQLELRLTARNAPQLRLNDHYQQLLADLRNRRKEEAKLNKADREAARFIKEKTENARWFIDALQQRYQTLYSVMHQILRYQEGFFLSGDDKQLRPMILKDIAEPTGLDISTVSRVANSKFVQTEYGTFPLKYFFSEGMTNTDGEEISTIEVKNVLREIIAAEDKRKPLNDTKLQKVLAEKGYEIARRTVAKYREQLGLPVARLRKEL